MVSVLVNEFEGLSLNSKTAKIGFKAEKILIDTSKPYLEEYFNKEITRIIEAPPRKKTDIIVEFADGTNINIQNKNGANERGFSVDRREHINLPISTNFKEAIAAVCLKSKDKTELEFDQNSEEDIYAMLNCCFLGNDIDMIPDFITHTIIENGLLKDLWICPINVFIEYLKIEAFETYLIKRTCIHIGLSLYIQRKGGHTKEKKADDVELKWKELDTVEKLFIKINLE